VALVALHRSRLPAGRKTRVSASQRPYLSGSVFAMSRANGVIANDTGTPLVSSHPVACREAIASEVAPGPFGPRLPTTQPPCDSNQV
jgi:hypothetical protein